MWIDHADKNIGGGSDDNNKTFCYAKQTNETFSLPLKHTHTRLNLKKNKPNKKVGDDNNLFESLSLQNIYVNTLITIGETKKGGNFDQHFIWNCMHYSTGKFAYAVLDWGEPYTIYTVIVTHWIK